ncbi:MAG: galactosyldiacylglycerol synthase [Clostridia bacterium]|nr:galactosyldiacylglycerol synthase [Clostridia bacterium]
MNILILSASTGGGHMTAAKALKSYILAKDADTKVEIVDTLEYISPILNRTISDSYAYMIKKSPRVFATIYHASNKDSRFSDLVVLLNNFFSKKLLGLIEKFQPDAIVTTHMFPNEMVSYLKEKNKISKPLICIMTDYVPHKTWISRNVDAYIVANNEMKTCMIKWGVAGKNIYPFGIPVNEAFYAQKNKSEILNKLSLKLDIPTILIMAGSFGVTNILNIYNDLLEIEKDFQIIVITGKNQKLYEAFDKKLNPQNYKISAKINFDKIDIIKKSIKIHSDVLEKLKKSAYRERKAKPTRLIFFTGEVYDYMKAADLIITKPGGLTVSEALASNLPLAIFNAVPGQEEGNADFLVKNNMAVKIGNGKNCKEIIEELICDKVSLSLMKDSCKKFDKSKSNENIYSLIKELAYNCN